MTHSLIRTRAEEDAADLVLKRSTSPVLPSTAADIAPITPSASSAMDSMWSEYEQYLQAARAAQEAGIDIFPQPAFVVKVSLVNDSRKGRATTVKRDLLEEDERAESESDKLFINVCTDACVDAPEIVKQSSDVPPSTSAPSAASSSTPTAAPPGSLRLPMSVGPLTPCTSRSGSPSLSVDVVIHPSTLIQPLDATHSQAAYQYAVAQAALIQRHSGTAPPILTPDQQQAMAMRELRRTVATFALQRVEEKYQLRVDAEAEVKFPKAAYKGSLPPPAQRIRRNKDNPLHAMTPQQREETERRGKVLVQEVAHVPHSKPASSGTTTSAVPIKAATPPVPQPSQQGNTAAAQRDSNQTQQTEKQATVSEAAEQTKQEATAVEQPKSISQRPTAAEEAPATTPVYSLDVADGQLILQVQLPGVVSRNRTAPVAPQCCCAASLLLAHHSASVAVPLLCSRRALRWTPLSRLLTFVS